jgi:hypothetical protein
VALVVGRHAAVVGLFEGLTGGEPVGLARVAEGAVALTHAGGAEEEVRLSREVAVGARHVDGVLGGLRGGLGVPVGAAQNLPRVSQLPCHLTRPGIDRRPQEPSHREGRDAREEDGYLPQRTRGVAGLRGNRRGRDGSRWIDTHDVASYQPATRLPHRAGGFSQIRAVVSRRSASMG